MKDKGKEIKKVRWEKSNNRASGGQEALGTLGQPADWEQRGNSL